MQIEHNLRKKINLAGIFFSFFSGSTLACGGHLQVSVNAGIIPDAEYASNGDTLYKKEGTLASLAGKNIDLLCLQEVSSESEISRLITVGRMNGYAVGKNIYATNLSGIGVRITVATQLQSHQQWRQLPYIGTEKAKSNISAKDIFVRIELIKTSDESPSGIIYYKGNNALIFNSAKHFSPGFVDINITARRAIGTCHFLHDSVDIDLGEIPIRKLQAISNGRINPHHFELPVRCENVRRVFMTLQGLSHKGRKDVLALLASPDSAKGIGIQLQYNNIPLYLGIPIPLSDLFTKSNTQFISLTAGYIIIGKITPGKVEGIATLKLDYI